VRSGEVLSVSFQTYVMDFVAFAPTPSGAPIKPKDLPTWALLSPAPDKPVAPLRAELHRRLSDWLYAFAFGAIAAYFGGSVGADRRRRMRSIAAGIVMALALRGLGFMALSGSGSSSIMAVLSYAGPISIAVLFACLGFLRTTEGLWRAFGGRVLLPLRNATGLSAGSLRIAQPDSYRGGRL